MIRIDTWVWWWATAMLVDAIIEVLVPVSVSAQTR